MKYFILLSIDKILQINLDLTLLGINSSQLSFFLIYIQNIRMQETIDYNFLIIGRSGAGKSATTKLLTGDPSITVANSLKEVTVDVHFYRGMKIQLPNHNQYIRFNVLDLPGLDRLNNRFKVRSRLLQELQNNKISLNGIIYVSSLTERDTMECDKLFKFIEQLPWGNQQKKNALIPILTKYDNLIIDSPEQEIASIKQQYGNVFEDAKYGCAWNKRIYWINHTKSLQFKMKIREEIRQNYSKQISRLLEMAKKNKNLLTVNAIKEYIKKEEKYVGDKLIKQISTEKIPCLRQNIQHSITLQIMIRPKKFYQSFTTVSASSIGMIISQVCKHEVPASLCIFLSGIPMVLAFWNLTKSTTKMDGKAELRKSKEMVANQQKLQSICKNVNKELQKQWNNFTQNLQFYLQGQFLYCRLNNINSIGFSYRFLEPFNSLKLKINQNEFVKVFNDQVVNQGNQESPFQLLFRIQVPQFEEESVWQPQIEVSCQMKVFEEDILLKFIENNRIQFDQNSWQMEEFELN